MPRKLVVLLAGVGGLLLWRRARRVSAAVEVFFDDGSLIRLDRGVEAEDLRDDCHALLGALS